MTGSQDIPKGKGTPPSFLKRGVILMAIRVYGVGMTFLVTILLARGLGADGYGRYAYLFAIVTLATLPTQFGLPDLVVRETSLAISKKSGGILPALWRWAHGFVAVSSLLVIAVTWVAIGLLGGAADSLETTAVTVAFLLIPLIALSNLRAAILRGLGFDLLGQLPEHAIRPTLFAVGLLALLLLQDLPITVAGAFLVQVGAVGIAALFGVLLMLRLFPKVATIEPSQAQRRNWYRATFFMGSISGLLLINNSVDIIMLGLWRTNTEIGQYRLASTVGAMITLGLQTMNLYAMPHLARHIAAADVGKLKEVTLRATQISFGFSLLALSGLLLLGEPVLAFVFGAEFSAAFPVLLVLAGGHLVNAFFGPAHPILIMAGREHLAAALAAVATVANVMLNVLLIPLYGPTGAALASAVSIATAKAIIFVIVWRQHGILSWPFPSLRKGVQ